MVELKSKDAFDGALPLEIGGIRLKAADLGVLTSLAPLGDVKKCSAALEKAHALALPDPGRATGKQGARCIWFSQREVLLAGPAPDAALAKHAAVVDVSDGWACATLEGEGVEDVMARLVPVDLRGQTFKRGHTVRTLVQHMSASITKVGPERFLILVFRSMAGTLVHDLKTSMEAVAARR